MLKGDSIIDNKKRMQELRRKNQITNLCKEWMTFGVLITMDDFLEVDETLLLQSNIFKKLDEMDRNNTSIIYQGDAQGVMDAFKELLIKNLKNNGKYIFFVRGAAKIGALVLDGKTIKENHQFIVMESELFHNGCSIFFASINTEKGICLWKGEYDSRIYVW